MNLREMIGLGQRVVVTEDFEDLKGLVLIDSDLQGYGPSMGAAENNIIKNAREVGATVLYDLKVSSRPGFDRRHDKFTCFGMAYGPR